MFHLVFFWKLFCRSYTSWFCTWSHNLCQVWPAWHGLAFQKRFHQLAGCWMLIRGFSCWKEILQSCQSINQKQRHSRYYIIYYIIYILAQLIQIPSRLYTEYSIRWKFLASSSHEAACTREGLSAHICRFSFPPARLRFLSVQAGFVSWSYMFDIPAIWNIVVKE